MATQYSSVWCKRCGQYRQGVRQGANHVLHLLLSVLTLGWWIPVWILICICGTTAGWRCSQCGYQKGNISFLLVISVVVLLAITVPFVVLLLG